MDSKQHLFSLYGDLIPLKFPMIEENIANLLSDYQSSWVQYNRKKPHIKRFGLSLTSLDGGLSGIPDLDSVKEYNELHKVSYDEKDFNVRTPVANCSHAEAKGYVRRLERGESVEGIRYERQCLRNMMYSGMN